MTGERMIVIPKRALQIGLLLALLVSAVLLGAPLFKSSPEEPHTDATTSAAEDADMDAALEAASHAVREVMWFDHTEGREAWALRIDPICTPNGMAFWNGPFFAEQVWPTMMERRYVSHDIEVLDATIAGEGSVPSSVIIAVTLRIKYTLGDDAPVEEENTNEIVMVCTKDGQWLNDGAPSPSIRHR